MTLIGRQESAVDTMSDWVAESMQEIVRKMNKAERGFILIPSVHIDDQEC